MTDIRPPLPVTRRGTTLVLIALLLVLASAIVFASADLLAGRSAAASRDDRAQGAQAALEAVLARREVKVLEMATAGDPAAFVAWKGNFGEDLFAGCRVRWKVEPCVVEQPPDPAHPTAPVSYITNPPDDTGATSADPSWQANEVTYVYRLSGEARLLADGAAWDAPVDDRSRAQGVRYIAVNNLPLFRYVIFYAQNGPKGDLELSHADGVNIQGNVHSNGAIYVGGGLKVNDKVSRLGSVDGSFQSTETLIGPDVNGDPVRVTGVGGIFRLSKPLAYSIINDFPLGDTTGGNAGTADWTATGSYLLDTAVFPGESGDDLFSEDDEVDDRDLATVAAATRQGRKLNPYRILGGSGAVTVGATTGPIYAVADDARQINNVPLRGLHGAVTAEQANDSRDHGWGGATFAQRSLEASPPGFAGAARSRLNGGAVVRLPPLMRNRALEPQILTYVDADSDSTTDDHEYARPAFVKPDGSTSLDLPAAGAPVVESPGQYLRYALGVADGFLTRRADGTGWDVRAANGVATVADPDRAGLIIRERPIPDTVLWPGTGTAGTLVDASSSRYLPYAYGKQWYPMAFPFTIADVSDRLRPGVADAWRVDASNVLISTAAADRVVSWGNGQLTVASACAPGPNDSSDRWSGTAYAGFDHNSFKRLPYFYRNDWRFIHLNAGQPDTAQNGVRVWTFANRIPDDTDNLNQAICATGVTTSNPTAITAPASGVTATFTTSGVTPTFTSVRRSARFEGFLYPTVTAAYTFTCTVGSSQGARVWLDGTLVAVAGSWGAGPLTVATPTLTAGQKYPIQAEYYNDANGSPSLDVRWARPSVAAVSIPTTALRPTLATRPVAFDKANVKAVQMRISSATGAVNGKVGLMLRDGGGSLSPLENGAAPYVMVGYNPTRGFFSERRLARAWQDVATLGQLYYIGAGTGVTAPTAANANGEILDNSTAVAGVVRSATLGHATGSPSAITTTAVLYEYDGNPSTSVTWSQNPVAYSGPLSKDIGGGVVWTLQTPFYTGPCAASKTWTPRKRSYQYKQQTLTLNLAGALAPFKDASDNGKTINFFTSTTGTGQVANSSGTLNSNWTWNGGTATNRTSIRRTYNGNYSYSATITGTMVSANGAWGDDLTLWASSDYPLPKISKNGSAWVTATEADIEAFMNGTNYTKNSNSKSTLSNGIVRPAAYAEVPTSAVPNPAAPANPTIPDFATARTFSVQRAGSTVTFDCNAWISAACAWFGTTDKLTAVDQYRPWVASWGVPAASLVPNAGGLRPDWWKGTAAPATPTAAANGVTNSQANTPNASLGSTTVMPKMTDDVPATIGATEIWLRLEKDAATGRWKFLCYSGTSAPADAAAFTEIAPLGADSRADLSAWSAGLLIGPCFQSGSQSTTLTATVSDLKIELAASAADDADLDNDLDVDKTDWEGAAGGDVMARYLASQYQVFWGPREITEDFFTYAGTNGRLASEDWFYQNREFWSQNRLWDHTTGAGATIAKDSSSFADVTNRSLLAKTTVLTLDLRNVQDYLKTRTLNQALVRRLSDPLTPATVSDSLLASRFNGLFYAVRTDRYPWNPNSNPGLGASQSGANPYSPSANLLYPNSTLTAGGTLPLVANGTRLDAWAPAALLHEGVHKLLPADYVIAQAPAFKPQNFHHGIRIRNAASVDWGYPIGATATSLTTTVAEGSRTYQRWTYPATPAFGISGTSIVTPNLLYIQGDLNRDTHVVDNRGTVEAKHTPVAVMGDVVTLLSNAWSDLAYQQSGLTVTNVAGQASVSGTGTLVCTNNGLLQVPFATTTTYNSAIVTHNLPSSRERVREGQAAPFVDTTLFLENWNARHMWYMGSLVVLDSRRYSKAFLHDVFKVYGNTPFGLVGNTDWMAQFGGGAPDWLGQAPIIFSEPIRHYAFNYDFLTAEGTPPFTPFGVTAAGVGGWMRVLE